jgi:dsRNA-specific ribonuclease
MSYKSMSSSIYRGTRGTPFHDLITKLMSRGNLKDKYIDILTNDENMRKFSKAFTAASANSKENYEIYEQLGDVSANKFIVWYAYKRFPQLDCPLGVKVVARLRINYGAKNSFAQIADNLGFWPFISAAEDGTDRSAKYRTRHKKDLLEDVFEAFVGCTEQILDNQYRPGVGYGVVYDILASIFDKIPISLKFEDLMDAKTRMKEIFDAFGDTIGSYQFIDTRDYKTGPDGTSYSVAISSLYQVPSTSNRRALKISGPQGQELRPNRGWNKIGEGSGTTKSAAQQQASEQGILTLNRKGYIKEVPAEYRLFCR